MELRQLGATGLMIPEVGLGTWKYRGGVGPLQRGIELGAHVIDTAEAYGTEVSVGKTIHDRRDRVFLATKVSGQHLRYDQVLKAADASLRRLGVVTIDLYQIHWPDPAVPIGETMRAMEELVDMGKVRFIGVSNFSRQQLQSAQAAMTKYRIVANQVEYSLLDRHIEKDLASFYQPNQITVIAYSPFAEGELLRGESLRALESVAREVGRTPAQVALNWCLTRPGVVVIPKSDSADRIAENCDASGWSLTAEQVIRLEVGVPQGRSRAWAEPSE